ncbi:chromosome segregation protein-like protein [Lindgomyces ingoldianus]|uniref:Chromosome segregation protein-like protein n=1 Tax=Lindgomyces ingoldianus TaxID=673940 RepID=A0ACB6Q9U1_9PLEO|nr:chromosome segregation protein-like protein [Lindgomyces ingoldianus]KAF2463650.1 chromosome segregation protein-like protein [Lindgomyces ingoldianus]
MLAKMALQQRIRGRHAHTPGATFLTYTPNGKKLITAGVDNFCRIFSTGSDDEPVMVDECMENSTAIVASNGFFIAGAEDGTVSKYSLADNTLDQVLVRASLPVRDLALSPDGTWVAVASDELVVKVVNTQDNMQIQILRDQPRAVKHVAFDHSGSHLAVSCTDGNIYMYSLSSEEPNMIKKVDGMIKSLESDAEASSKVLWHPDGRAFATPTAGREIQVMSFSDWERQRAFNTSHSADITAAAWSPNGALLATTSSDMNLCLWDAKTQKLLKKYADMKDTILAMVWHPTENILSYTNNGGELFIHTGIVPEEHISLLEKSLQSAPFFHDPSEGRSGNAIKPANGATNLDIPHRRPLRAQTPDSLADILGPMSDDEDMADFVVDDDGAGYAPVVNGHGKRTNGHLGVIPNGTSKRRAYGSSFEPEIHEAFQPGSTPWRGNRRYLCLNLTGFVWTVSQESGHHNTVTVEFYDREFHRDFHFTDPFLYDKACLNDNGTLFSCQPSHNASAMIYYRPHETWTTRTDWRTNLPKGEDVTAIALSDSYVVVTTSANYVRVYTLFGIPVRVYRQKASPAVTCAAWRDYVLTIGNGPIGGDGMCQLLYTIENVKRDEVYQSGDIVALTPNSTLTSVFFSDNGDPYIYDSTGVLLTLLHWRSSGQARWVPMLDTRLLSRLETGAKEESYWPVAVANRKFHCIILKGADQYPYFPRSILSEFEFQIPLTSPSDNSAKDKDEDPSAMNDDEAEGATGKKEDDTTRLTQTLILSNTLHTQLSSTLSHTRGSPSQRQTLIDLEVAIDRTLLQLLGLECLAGEDRGMKALEIVTLMRDANGKMLDLASKVAQRYGREVLGEKIRELAERRLVGLEGEDED